MGHFFNMIILLFVISSQALGYPLDTDARDLDVTVGNSSMCYYKGIIRNDGELINVDEPCLLCRCQKGALSCSLRVCTDIPDPPPPGCYTVRNTNQCCPQIVCQNGKRESNIEVRTISGSSNNLKVCVVNGSLYAEGSALESSDTCEFCYCIQGQQKCIKPKCSMPFEGCKAMYSQNSCCPTHYDCRDLTSNVSKSPDKNVGCMVDGVIYAEGEMLNSSNCQNCYCMKGKVRCIPVTCETQFNGDCNPVYKPGQCCPTSYICSKTVMGISENSIRLFTKRINRKNPNGDMDTGTTDSIGSTFSMFDTASNTTEGITSTLGLDEALVESTTFVTRPDEIIKSRVDDLENGTETDPQKKTTQEEEEEEMAEVTTAEVEYSTLQLVHPAEAKKDKFDIASRNHVDYLFENKTATTEENTTLPPILAEIYSSSSHTDDEYDSYDYNEPRLPPSLPNLIIFPFVAADAVVKDEVTTKSANYDEGIIKRVGTEPVFYKDYFSPPTKTEGGFIPKSPPVLTNIFHEHTYIRKDGSLLPGQTLTPPKTAPPKTNADQCILKGRLYEHGELLSEPGDCQSCICYYGDVLCQDIICPPLRQGCRRSFDKDKKSCCGEIICNHEDNGHLGYKQSVETTSNNPIRSPITVPDVIQVTPQPHRDVLQTEQAPDIPSLMGELPVYLEQQTKKPVTVTYKNLVIDYYPDFLVTTTRDDVRKNYKNPIFYGTTEIYPFTEKSQAPVNVTFPTQQTVTSSISTSEDDLEGHNSKYPYGKLEYFRTTLTPIVTVATEPSKLFEYYSVEEYKATPKQQVTRRTRPSRPVKKTTEIPSKEDQYNVLSTKLSNTGKHRYSTKSKSKFSTTTVRETQTKSTVDKNVVDEPFSLDSVLRFFFDTETTTLPPMRKTTKKDPIKKFTTNSFEERSRQTNKATTPIFKYKDYDPKAYLSNDSVDSLKKPVPDNINRKSSIAGLLKLAGCNIYGRMYRVGKIIAELSNPCLECVCTDFGVECNQLRC